MRVRVEMTVDVDPREWAELYGLKPADVREDVKMHVVNTVREQLYSQLATVAVS